MRGITVQDYIRQLQQEGMAGEMGEDDLDDEYASENGGGGDKFGNEDANKRQKNE